MKLNVGYYIDDPAKPVHEDLVAYEGVTTSDGAAAGNTIVDTQLAAEPSYVNLLVKVLDGDAAGQARWIVQHTAGSSTLTVDSSFTDSAGAAVQIVGATRFAIISDYEPEVLYMGTATSAGAVDGSTLVDTGLATPFTADDVCIGHTVRILTSGTASLVGQEREIYDYDYGTNTLYFATPYTAQVPSGTTYSVLRNRPSSGGGPGPQPEPAVEEVAWKLADSDPFDVADALADTERWSSEYQVGAADGSADINTSTTGALYVNITAAAVAAAQYGVRRLWACVVRKFLTLADATVKNVVTNANEVWAGLAVSRGVAWDTNNYLAIYKAKSTTTERIRVEYNLAGAGVVQTNIVNTTQTALAFKIERENTLWRLYYSLTQRPRHRWILALEVEDPTNSLTDTTSVYLTVYNPEDAAAQRVSCDFTTWEYYETLGNLGDIISLVNMKGGALAYLGYCLPGMAASTTVIVCPNLAGFLNDAFNTGYQMVILRNANALASPPEMEMRDITDYVSATGTFTTEAFSVNVEASDIVIVIHNSVAKSISALGIADAGSGVSLIRDAARTEGDNWWNGQQVIMLSGLARGQVRPIWDFLAATDDILVSPDFDAAVAAGDVYAIISQYSDIVPRTADDTENELTSQVIGRKDDTPVPLMSGVPAVSGTVSNLGYLKALIARGMASLQGVVDAGVSSATIISSDDLIGYGDDYFNTGYQMVLLKNANAPGTAPEMEVRDITDYVSNTGAFTVEAFSVVVEASDVILIVHVSLSARVATYGLATGGAAGTIIDTRRTEADDYWNGLQVVMLSGNGRGQVRPIYDFDAATDTIFVTPNFAGAVAATDAYAILSQWTDLTADPTAGNRLLSEVVGNKEDAAVYLADAVTTAMSYLKGLIGAEIEAYGAADAGSDADTLVDAARTEAIDYWNGLTLLMLTGNNAGLTRPIVDYAVGSVEVRPAFPNAIAATDVYVILSNYHEIVPGADGGENYQPRDVIGNKSDTIPAMNLAPAATDSLVRHIKAIMERVGATPADPDDSLLTNVGQRDDAATADDLSDVTTTAMQAKLRRILLRMSPDAFAATVQGNADTALDTMLGDLATYFVAAGAAMALQVNGNAARTNLQQALSDFFAAFGCDAANVFNPTIQGAARTDLDAALYNMATYFAAAGAAWSVQINGNAARTNLEQVWEDFSAVFGANGANIFNPTIQGAGQTDLDAALAQLAVYFAAAGAAMSIQVQGGAARANLELVLEDYFAVVGCDGANLFNPTIQGAAQATFDAAFAALATYISAAGAAYSATVNPGGAARTNIEQTLEDLGDMLAGAGITTFPARSLPGDGISLAETARYTAEVKPEFATATTATHTTTTAAEETILTTAYTVPGLFYFDLDLANMVAGDDFTIRVYKRVDGTNYRLKSQQNYVGAQTIDVYEIEGLYFDSGQQIRLTIQRNSGTDRAFPYRLNSFKQPVA